jgi:hypothetical protein
MARSSLKIFSPCAMVLGLMALSAAAAQATVGAHWWVLDGESKKIDAGSLEAEVGLEKDSTAITLHAELASHTKFLVLCQKLESENIKLKGSGGTNTGGKMKFSECTVDLNGELAPACEPENAVGGKGTILTNTVHGLIAAHEIESPHWAIKEVIVLLPDVGETFATIEMGAGCPVGTKVAVVGQHFVIEDSQGKFKEHLVKHLIDEGPLTELWVISKTEEHKATILGSALAFLAGKHIGLKFGGEAALPQEEGGGKWWILNAKGEKVDAASLEAEIGLGKDSTAITLHAKLSGGTEYLLECKNLAAESFKLKANGSTSSGKVKFSECAVYLNGVIAPACQPKDPVGGAGTVITKSLHGLIILRKLAIGTKDELVLLLPDVGEIWWTIEMGAECAVGAKVNLVGPHLVLKDCENLFKNHLVKHLLEEGPFTELWLISKTEEHRVNVSGSAWAWLEGAHTGLKFGGEAI